jgi:hypothetical protein
MLRGVIKKVIKMLTFVSASKKLGKFLAASVVLVAGLALWRLFLRTLHIHLAPHYYHLRHAVSSVTIPFWCNLEKRNLWFLEELAACVWMGASFWAMILGGELSVALELRIRQRGWSTLGHYVGSAINGVGQRVIDLRDLLRKADYPRRAVQYERW